ncbi:MAG: hypothetical protein JWR40_1907 [Massilia sp.]|nr:hypothetical protein [Massilia sp.]
MHQPAKIALAVAMAINSMAVYAQAQTSAGSLQRVYTGRNDLGDGKTWANWAPRVST